MTTPEYVDAMYYFKDTYRHLNPVDNPASVEGYSTDCGAYATETRKAKKTQHLTFLRGEKKWAKMFRETALNDQ